MPFSSSMGFVHGHEQSNIIITTTDFDGDHVENNRQQNQQQQVPRLEKND